MSIPPVNSSVEDESTQIGFRICKDCAMLLISTNGLDDFNSQPQTDSRLAPENTFNHSTSSSTRAWSLPDDCHVLADDDSFEVCVLCGQFSNHGEDNYDSFDVESVLESIDDFDDFVDEYDEEPEQVTSQPAPSSTSVPVAQCS